MGMAAVDMTMEQAQERRVATVDYQRIGIWRLRELARQQHPDHTDEAARVFVQRLLEMAAQWLTDYRHANTGYHPFSPASTAGEQPGGSTKAAEPLLIGYLRSEKERRHHEEALRWIVAARLPPRQLIAVLVQARKLHPKKGVGDCVWAKSYGHIAENIGRYAQLLGFGPVVPVVPEIETRIVESTVPREIRGRHEAEIVPRKRKERVTIKKPLFKNGVAIQEAARSGKAGLIAIAKSGAAPTTGQKPMVAP